MVIHVLRQPQSKPLAHQAVTGPDEEHVEDGAREERTCDDGCVGRHRIRHRHRQSHTPLKAEDQEDDPERRSWEAPVAPHVPEPDLLKALRHVQRRSPAHAWLVVVLLYQHHVLPRRHFGRTAFARPIIDRVWEIIHWSRMGLHIRSHTRTSPMGRSPVGVLGTRK